MCKEIGNGIEKVKEPKQTTPVELAKISSMFNLQSELAKLKISIPFNELLRVEHGIHPREGSILLSPKFLLQSYKRAKHKYSKEYR